jgi:hypothetical protein
MIGVAKDAGNIHLAHTLKASGWSWPGNTQIAGKNNFIHLSPGNILQHSFQSS